MLYDEKLVLFKNIAESVIKGISNYNRLDIINSNDYNTCFENTEKIVNLINTISEDNIINDLQYVNNSLSSLIKNFGVYNFNYLIEICLGQQYVEIFKKNKYEKYLLIEKYLHPISYKVLSWNSNRKAEKEVVKNKIIDDKQIINAPNLECFDMARTSTNFNIRVYGIKVILHDENNKKSILVNCLVDECLINNIDNKFILESKNSLDNFITNINNDLFVKESWNNYFNNIGLKELLIYNSQELFNKYISLMTQIIAIENKTLETQVSEFIGSDLYTQRNILIQLLLNDYKPEFQYIAYLLYDLLSDEKIINSDSCEQKILYNSLSWNCKKYFKNAMYKTVEYTSTLLNFDNSKIPLEQQICLMKADNKVKEKAMQKLKELKSKSEDSGSKARQYLDGLLKIPFGINKEEYILKKKIDINSIFSILKEDITSKSFLDIMNKIDDTDIKNFFTNFIKLLENDTFNNIQIIKIINYFENSDIQIYNYLKIVVKKFIGSINKKKVLVNILSQLSDDKIIKNLNIIELKKELVNYIDKNVYNKVRDIVFSIENIEHNKYLINLLKTERYINEISKKNKEVTDYINSFNDILDNAIYGHKNAKIQIERILGQWINGEKTGYCFGFEGPPGVGKTSLAKKGIANCLKDVNGESRPFSFIAIGGASNGSMLDGHNYTYVGSTWGKIVDILIEHKCMNPIIFIDELDKVSKTEHGKEIIGILTHLVDTTQNSGFQDKYFSNIDLDLSKALFIFSYNDVELIDSILLDRIHRIKFDNLLLSDKLVIADNYILPELYKKFDIDNILIINEDITKYLIETFTNESGVRKLKEILYEVVSSINLDLIKNNKYEIPLIVTKDIIDEILNEKHHIRYLKINDKPTVGIINGMWANAFGNSGILHIESSFCHSNNLLELKLTGMQGDVMKESMSVAKTMALSLLNKEENNNLNKKLENNKVQGIHIHVPEGATPKDGPSAGGAITLVLYSLLTGKKIRNDVAITGEICLQGKITAIGGLDLKIIGGIRAGVKTFLYPEDNKKDFELFLKKYKGNLDEYKFYSVKNIYDAMKLVIIK